MYTTHLLFFKFSAGGPIGFGTVSTYTHQHVSALRGSQPEYRSTKLLHKRYILALRWALHGRSFLSFNLKTDWLLLQNVDVVNLECFTWNIHQVEEKTGIPGMSGGHQLSCWSRGSVKKLFLRIFLGQLVPFVLNMPLAGDHFVPTPKRVAERAPRRLLEFGGCGSKQNQWQQCKRAGKKGWDTSTKAAPNACRSRPCHHLGRCMTKFQTHFIQPY